MKCNWTFGCRSRNAVTSSVFVGGQLVENHADCLIGLAGQEHFPQEAVEVVARVPIRRLAHDVAGLNVQCRVERRRAVETTQDLNQEEPTRPTPAPRAGPGRRVPGERTDLSVVVGPTSILSPTPFLLG